MRLLIPALLVACSTPPTGSGSAVPALDTDAAAASTPGSGEGGYVGRPAFEMPPQEPPTPADAVLGELIVGASTWTLEDGRTLVLGPEQASLAGESVPLARVPGGATLGERRLRAVAPCAAALYEDRVWVEAVRPEPACTPAERTVAVDQHVTWDLPGGDRYTLLPGGKVWRRGPKRAFKRPVGAWTTEGDHRVVAFDKSVYDLIVLDPCHTVYALREPSNAYRAVRSFPGCDPSQATYDGFAWTLWSAPSGDRLDVRAQGELRLDLSRVPEPVVGTWEATEGPFRTVLGGVEGELHVVDCVATLKQADGSEQAFTRIYPKCGGTPAVPKPPR